jgi:hypothetical protein
MNKEKINLEFLGISRKKIITGDVFVMKPRKLNYYYGIVANADAKIFSAEGLLHIHFFDFATNDYDNNVPDELCDTNLLIPPVLTNKLAWQKGYFKTIGNTSTDKFRTIKEASFYYYNGEIFDDRSNQLDRPYSMETTGSFSITSYLNIDNIVSLRLGIPPAVSSPENWNPYWYQEELRRKFNWVVR